MNVILKFLIEGTLVVATSDMDPHPKLSWNYSDFRVTTSCFSLLLLVGLLIFLLVHRTKKIWGGSFLKRSCSKGISPLHLSLAYRLTLYRKSCPWCWYLNTDNTQIHNSSLCTAALQFHVSNCLMGFFTSILTSAKIPFSCSTFLQ